jgi:hypothetical protein
VESTLGTATLMARLDILILCCVAFAFLVLWYIDRQVRDVTRQIEFDSPLREVIAVNVEIQRKCFSEALKLSDEEIDAAPRIVRGIRLRLQVWKTHYSGDIAFYGKLGEGPCWKREDIQEFPTSTFQFLLVLAQHPLLGPADESRSDFGLKAPEGLEVLLSHKAIIIRGRDGRFECDAAGHCYKPRPSDLVIPTREADLREYVDTFGLDDPDWLMVTGRTRHYERRGRWAVWTLCAVSPKSVSSTISSLDDSAVKPND